MCNFMKSRLWGLKFQLRRPTSNFTYSYHTYGHAAYDEAATALGAEVTDP